MVIELLEKGDKFIVRYKKRWLWWYVGKCEGDWIWSDDDSEMDKEEAESVIENLKENYAQENATPKVVRQEIV